jgi:uncharacterized small protein (DUF1192 family)
VVASSFQLFEKQRRYRKFSLNFLSDCQEFLKLFSSIQLNERLALITAQLEEERKRSEDLQFSLDEASIQAEDTTVSFHLLVT